MRRILTVGAVVLVAVAAGFVVGQRAAAQSGDLKVAVNPKSAAATAPEDQTKIARFESRKGRLYVKDFYTAGKIRGKYQDAEVQALVITSAADNDKVFGVKLTKEASSSYGSSTVAVLDFEEAVALSDALDRMATMASQMAQASREYTEVEFQTLSGFKAGFYQSGLEQASYFRLEQFGSDATVFGDVAQLLPAKGVIDGAVAKLRELGAR